jgi:hypothetical protein
MSVPDGAWAHTVIQYDLPWVSIIISGIWSPRRSPGEGDDSEVEALWLSVPLGELLFYRHFDMEIRPVHE